MRFKITFKLGSPLIVYEPIMFDSLLLFCYLEEKFGTVPQPQSIKEEDHIMLPDGLLNKHESGVWLASQMISNDEPLLDVSNFTKHWEESMQHLIAKQNLKIETTKGIYKSYNLPLETKNYDSIYFIIDAIDIGKITVLLNNHAFSLGKKRNRGYGKVDKIIIEKTDEMIIRPVPDENGSIYLPINPPYWRLTGIVQQSVKEI